MQEGLVALDVGDHVIAVVFPAAGDFRHAIGAGRMPGGRHLHRGAQGATHVGHLLTVRGHQRVIENAHGLDTAPYPFQQGPAEEEIEGFVGEPRGGEPRGDDPQNAAAQRHPPEPDPWRASATVTPRKLPLDPRRRQPTRRWGFGGGFVLIVLVVVVAGYGAGGGAFAHSLARSSYRGAPTGFLTPPPNSDRARGSLRPPRLRLRQPRSPLRTSRLCFRDTSKAEGCSGPRLRLRYDPHALRAPAGALDQAWTFAQPAFASRHLQRGLDRHAGTSATTA